MIIKLLLVTAVAGAAVFAMRSQATSTNLAVKRAGSLLFGLVATLSVLFPDAVTWAAKLVGVHRGTDLVLYVLVVCFLFVTIGLHQRLHVLEMRLTQLTRELALRSTGPVDDSSTRHARASQQ
jgi:hypothetical protein